jgi:hydroxyethylthiazole kinase
MTTPSAVWRDVVLIRGTAPLIHNITNYVVMNTTANALLAIGASPVMAHAIDEVEDMVRLAGALVINIGTLSPPWVDAMFRAGNEASRRGIPIVLDPVGAGATPYRTDTALRLGWDISPAIIRGNASEIRALVQADATTRGVDSAHSAEASIDHARRVAEQYQCTVSMSGATDIILTRDAVTRVNNGHPIMPRITGLGCTATALTGAFAAVNRSAFDAAVHAMIVMGIAGEIAAERAAGPGSFWVHFLDVLYALQESDIAARMRASDG